MAKRNNIELSGEGDEDDSNNSCAIVYGNLPPNTKKE